MCPLKMTSKVQSPTSNVQGLDLMNLFGLGAGHWAWDFGLGTWTLEWGTGLKPGENERIGPELTVS